MSKIFIKKESIYAPAIRKAVQKVKQYSNSEDENLKQDNLKQENRKQDNLRQENSKQDNLRQETMERENLRQETMERENLKQETMEQENLKQENMKRENLKQGNLKQDNLKQGNLKQDNLRQETMERENLKRDNLRQETMERENLKQENMKRENLRQENLKQGNLKQGNLKQGNLKQDNLKQGNLKQGNLKQENSKQDNIKRENLKQGNLKQDNLRQENLKQGNLKQGNLKQDNLRQENLKQENLKQGNLKQDNLRQETMEQENLKQENIEKSTDNNEIFNILFNSSSRNILNKLIDNEKLSNMKFPSQISWADPGSESFNWDSINTESNSKDSSTFKSTSLAEKLLLVRKFDPECLRIATRKHFSARHQSKILPMDQNTFSLQITNITPPDIPDLYTTENVIPCPINSPTSIIPKSILRKSGSTNTSNKKISFSNQTEFLLAIEDGDLYKVKEIQKSLSNFNQATARGFTAIHIAVLHNHIEIVKYFIQLGVNDINSQDIRGQSPLHIAALNNNYQIIELLLKNGACPFIFSEYFDAYPIIMINPKSHNGNLSFNILKNYVNDLGLKNNGEAYCYCDHHGNEKEDLTVSKAEKIFILKKDELVMTKKWLAMKENGEKGLIPWNILTLYPGVKIQ